MNTRIKAVRAALGLSQRAFGERLGVSRDVISNIESGRRVPKAPFLQLLCAMYGVDRRWLDTGDGEMFSGGPPSDKLGEALTIFQSLRPDFQDYALSQIRLLAQFQNRER